MNAARHFVVAAFHGGHAGIRAGIACAVSESRQGKLEACAVGTLPTL